MSDATEGDKHKRMREASPSRAWSPAASSVAALQSVGGAAVIHLPPYGVVVRLFSAARSLISISQRRQRSARQTTKPGRTRVRGRGAAWPPRLVSLSLSLSLRRRRRFLAAPRWRAPPRGVFAAGGQRAVVGNGRRCPRAWKKSSAKGVKARAFRRSERIWARVPTSRPPFGRCRSPVEGARRGQGRRALSWCTAPEQGVLGRAACSNTVKRGASLARGGPR